MSTIEDINNVLSGQSATHGWDAMVAYNRDRVNTLFHQQYLEKVRAGEHYSPFNHESETTATGYHFKNLVLGPPRISFDNSTLQDSKVSVRMMFTDGSFIRTDSNNQVVQWDRYTPASKYGLNITIELKYGTGKVSEDGKVTIDFTEGQIYEIEGLNGLPADVVLAFQNFLKNNPMSYTLGELKRDDNQENLYPVEFVVRTQKYPGSSALASSSNADGAVLVFIQTEYGGKGTLPSDNNSQPWVIPEGKSATLLISDRLLYGPLLSESFNSRIKDFKWQTSETDGNYSLKFTDGYVPTTNVITQNYGGIGFQGWMKSAEAKGQPRPARFSMADFQITKSDDYKSIIGTFIEKQFTDTFEDNGSAPVPGGGTWDDLVNIKFSREGQFKAMLQLSDDSNVTFIGNPDFKVTSNNDHWGAFIGKDASVVFASEAQENLNKSGLFSLPDIKTFYLSNVLFPGDNILSFSDVYNPGDLALYGDVAQSLTTLIITPDESVIGCGQTLQFSASQGDDSAPQGLIWSVDGVGSIDSNGLYTAPATGEITQTQNVIITATTSGGLKSIAIGTVLVSALDVEPAFILVKEKAMSTIQFTAYQAGSAQQEVTWTLDADVSDAGSIDKNGVYTPPAGQYDTDEPSVISAVATLPSGERSRAIICLWGEDIALAFPATPAYTLNVTENSTAGFSTQNLRADADGWQLYPQSGTLSDPRKQESSDKKHIWECDYQAPKRINRPELVFIKITEKKPASYAGYALVELQPPVSPWSRVTELSTLSISTVGSSAAGAEIYGNGLNQATMQINIIAQDGESENVIVQAQDILPYITLVDYYSGEEISNANVWAYTDKVNDYNTSPAVLQSGTNVISLYVTANQGELTKDIAVKIQLINPGVKEKYISTAKDSDNGFDSKVTIRTLQPINYSDKENIKYGSDTPVKIKNDLNFTVITGDSYVSKSTGECYQCIVEIAPAKQDISGFKTVIMDYNPVINETVNTETQSWGDIKNELSFSCVPYDKLRKSCSVAGYRAGSESADDPALKSTAMIYFDAKQFEGKDTHGLEGVIYFHNGDIKYRLEVKNIQPSSSDGSSIVFLGCLFKIPEAEVNPLGWKSSLNSVRIMVTDVYGNSGNITLRWDDQEHYVKPAII
ncbi:TPA: hypothetical protein QIB60_004802 [Enterobacter cloacae subsp. dissolvens]|nr:hypothetical protein [Enterobacter cloacae subsp. dissolvens]